MSLVTRKLGKWVCWEIPTEARDGRIIEELAGRMRGGGGGLERTVGGIPFLPLFSVVG